jgi:hypothetical protein
MDFNLNQLMRTISPQTEKKEDEGRDRKRLKERLKKASLLASKKTLQRKGGWLEFIFGITHGDRRIGKGKSRL